MHPQLEVIRRELSEATVRAEAILDRSPEDRLTQRPPDGGWSAAECIEHLTLTSRALLPQLDQALSGTLTVRLPARLRRDLVGWIVWQGVRPTTKMKAKTSAPFMPGSGRTAAEILAEFRELQSAMLEHLHTANSRPIDRIRIPSPFTERLRYSVFSAFTVLAAHQHRHLAQAERALTAIGV